MLPRIGTFFLAAGVAILAACASGPADAQERLAPLRKAGAAGDSEKLRAEYAALPTGDTLTSKGETWVALPDVRAMAGGSAPGGATVMERKGRLLVYKETRAEMKSARIAVVQDQGAGALQALTYPVVRNARTGNAGIVVGTIEVRLKDMAQTDAVAAAAGLTVSARYDHLGVAFLKAAPGQDIAAATDALRADARVVSADPEIVEHAKEPR